MRETTTGSFLPIANKTYRYFSASAVRIINLPSSLPRLFLRPVRGFVVSTRFTSDSRNKETDVPSGAFRSAVSPARNSLQQFTTASAFYEGATKGLTWVQQRPRSPFSYTIIGSFWETWKGARIPGTLKDECRWALGMGRLSRRKLYEGDLEGGLLYWWPRKIC